MREKGGGGGGRREREERRNRKIGKERDYIHIINI